VSLAEEQSQLEKLLKGRTVKLVWRRSDKELGVEFEDGTRLFVDWQPNEALELSVTEGSG